MANIRLAWNNAVVDALQFYTGDGWWTYDASILNLGKQPLGLRWLSGGLSAMRTRFTCGFTPAGGSDPTVALIALCSHNLSLAATVRIRASNVGTFASTTYDSGTLPAFAAGVTEASRSGMRWNFVHALSTATAAPYWRIEIVDSSNPAGFVSAGRLMAATKVWQPTRNMNLGSAIGWESNAENLKALSGAEFSTAAEPNRVLRIKFDGIPNAEMLANAFDLQRVVATGVRREVMVQIDPADGEQSVRRSFFGRVRELSPIEEPQPLHSAPAFELKELL